MLFQSMLLSAGIGVIVAFFVLPVTHYLQVRNLPLQNKNTDYSFSKSVRSRAEAAGALSRMTKVGEHQLAHNVTIIGKHRSTD